MQNRAYSVLEIKSVDEEKRIILGVATTPTSDRVGDIVEPLGVKFKNPMPLLWQHRSSEPVGQVRFDKPTKEGIDFEARLPKPTQSKILIERVDEAWESVKLGLVKAVSIGFRANEFSFMDDGGIHFQETEVLELSLVTIPANAEATITSIKSVDAPLLAASGLNMKGMERPKRPVRKDMDMMRLISSPASGEGQEAFMTRCVSHLLNCDYEMSQEEASAHCVVSWNNRGAQADRGASAGVLLDKKPPASGKPVIAKAFAKEKKMPKTVAEQISAYEATRAAKAARMEALMTKAADDGTTLSTEESEEYDTLDTEVAQIDVHLQRLAKMQKVQVVKAKAAGTEDDVDTETTHKRAGIGHNSGVRVEMKKPDLPKGTGFARLAIAMAAGKGDTMKMIQRAREWESSMPELKDIIEIGPQNLMDGLRTKAAVGAGTTTDATWASPLVAYNIMASEFIELLRPATIIGKITGLRRVPFNIQMPATTTGSSVNWVGENAPKPVSKMDFATVTLRWAKAAGIIVLTDELVRFSNPAAEAVVRQDLIDAMTQFLDGQFVDPAVAEIANVSPASITNGVTPVSRSGTNEAAFRADVKTLFNTFLAANLSTAGGVWIMTQQQALSLSLMINALGQPSFPTITGEGGTLLGYPVIASENVKSMGGSPADGSNIIFAKASEIMLADDGQTVIDASNQASVQMDSAPDSPPTASTTLVSLWQMNMTGVRAERWINWKKRRSTAVAFIQNGLYS